MVSESFSGCLFSEQVNLCVVCASVCVCAGVSADELFRLGLREKVLTSFVGTLSHRSVSAMRVCFVKRASCHTLRINYQPYKGGAVAAHVAGKPVMMAGSVIGQLCLGVAILVCRNRWEGYHYRKERYAELINTREIMPSQRSGFLTPPSRLGWCAGPRSGSDGARASAVPPLASS